MRQTNFTRAILLFIILLNYKNLFCQRPDSTKQTLNFKGTISATNNGFSLVPTFTLGKPALVTMFSVSGRRRFSFEPEFRYSLEDFKPWSFIFIWRYQLIRKEKFQLKIGTHLPALNFTTPTVVINGVEEDIIKARRFFPVFEAIPTYKISENFSLGMYAQYGRGLEKEVTSKIYFISLRPSFNQIPLTKQLFLRIYPQFYYLKIGSNDGLYVASNLALAHKNFPISISTMMNKSIETKINAKKFDWSLNLNYTFGNSYVEK